VIKIDSSAPEGKTVYPSQVIADGIGGLQEGQDVLITKIKASKAGTGYAFFTDSFYCQESEDHFEVMDFCWKNSKLGKTITMIFDNPKLADGSSLVLRIQDRLKSAVVISQEMPGGYWEQDELGELNFTFREVGDSLTAQGGTVSAEMSQNSASHSQDSVSPGSQPPSKPPKNAPKSGAMP